MDALSPAPAPAKHTGSTRNAIHVYGAEWCGFTRKQNKEIEDALKNDPDKKNKHIYIDCAKDKTNETCTGLQAFPLTIVHEVGTSYSTNQLTSLVQPGYRPGKMVVDELRKGGIGQYFNKPQQQAPVPPAPAPPAPAPPSAVKVSGSNAIHVYGAEWCGFTRKQNTEIKEALSKEPNGGNALVYIDCAGDGKDNEICKSLPGYPLTVVHERGKTYSPEDLMKISNPGYRPGNVVVEEWKASLKESPPENNVQFEIDSNDGKDKKHIHVYGANWCGFTRSQISELKDTLKHENRGVESLHVHECTDENLDPVHKKICSSLQGYPLTFVDDGPVPKNQPDELLKKHRLGKRPSNEVVLEWKKASGDNSPVKAPAKPQGGCTSCQGK